MFFQVKQVDADEKGKKIPNHQDFAHLDQQRLELHHALQQKVYQKGSLILTQNLNSSLELKCVINQWVCSLFMPNML